jgi:hypothetical protein
VTGYSNPDVYPAVVDLDNDGLPELIIPEKQSALASRSVLLGVRWSFANIGAPRRTMAQLTYR